MLRVSVKEKDESAAEEGAISEFNPF